MKGGAGSDGGLSPPADRLALPRWQCLVSVAGTGLALVATASRSGYMLTEPAGRAEAAAIPIPPSQAKEHTDVRSCGILFPLGSPGTCPVGRIG